MSDPPLSDMDFKNKMDWVWTILKKREILAERQMNQGRFVDFSNYSPIPFTNNILRVWVDLNFQASPSK